MSAPALSVHEALASVVRQVSHVAKKRSSGVNYEFRSIDAVLDALHPLLSGVGLTMSVEVDPEHLRLEYATVVKSNGKDGNVTRVVFPVYVRFVAGDGTSERFGPGLAQSDDYGDKAVYQAQQNALKYLLLSAFSIPVNEPDMDGRPGADVASLSQQWAQLLEAKPHVAEAFAERAGGRTFESLNRKSQQGWLTWAVGQ